MRMKEICILLGVLGVIILLGVAVTLEENLRAVDSQSPRA
jgi:hypothetical protein